MLERGPHRNEPSSKLLAEEFSNELYILHANLPAPVGAAVFFSCVSRRTSNRVRTGETEEEGKKPIPLAACAVEHVSTWMKQKKNATSVPRSGKKRAKGERFFLLAFFPPLLLLLFSFVDQNELAELFLVGRVETKETFRVRRKGNRRRETEQTRALYRRK